MSGPWWALRCCCGCPCLCPNCPGGKAACCFLIRKNGGSAFGVYQETSGGCIYINDTRPISLEFTATEVVIIWEDGKTYRGPIPTDTCCAEEWRRVDEEGGGLDYVEYYGESACATGNWCSNWIWAGIVPSSGGCGYKLGNEATLDRTLIRTEIFTTEGSVNNGTGWTNPTYPYTVGHIDGGSAMVFTTRWDGPTRYLDIEARLRVGGGSGSTVYWFKGSVLYNDYFPDATFREYAYQRYLDGNPIVLMFDRQDGDPLYKEQTLDFSGASVTWWPSPLLLGQSCVGEAPLPDPGWVPCWNGGAGLQNWNSWPTQAIVKPRPYTFPSPQVECYDPTAEYTCDLIDDGTFCSWQGPWIYMGERAGDDVWGRWTVHPSYESPGSGESVHWTTSRTQLGTGDPDTGVILGIYTGMGWDFNIPGAPPSNFTRCEGDGNAWNLEGLEPSDGAAVNIGLTMSCSVSVPGPEIDVDFTGA